MKKHFTLFCAIFLASSFASASGYWARSFATVTSGGTLYNYSIATGLTWTCDNNWATNTAFEAYDFGTPTTLVLNGGYGEAGSYGVDDYIDATSFTLYYRAYSISGTGGNWGSIALNNLFYSTGSRATATSTLNSIYNNVSAGIDVLGLVGNTAGTYYLEVILAKSQYWQTPASVWLTSNGDQNTAFVQSTASTGYKAKFIVSGTSAISEASKSLKISSEPGMIKAEFQGVAHIELFNVSGQKIRSVNADNHFSETVKAGVYLLRVNGETHKIVVR